MWSFFARDPVKDFAYEILPDTHESSGLWTLHRGKRKVTEPQREEETPSRLAAVAAARSSCGGLSAPHRSSVVTTLSAPLFPLVWTSVISIFSNIGVM